MYNTKNKIYLYLSKTQKTALCNFLRALTKKFPDFSSENILDKFLEDEQYYINLGNPHFEFVEEYLDDDNFINETSMYINACKRYYSYKQSLEPLIQANKEFEKKKRKFLQEVKMSKEPPTKKQLYYYDKLCKRYGIVKKDTAELSKLDLKKEISEIVNEYSGNS